MDNDLEKLRDELARQLAAGELEILHASSDGKVGMVNEISPWSIKCQCCNCELDSREYEHGTFFPCPNCVYSIWFPSFIVIPNFVGHYPSYIIEDENGKPLALNYKGDVRSFTSEEEAHAYIHYLGMPIEMVQIKRRF